MLSISKRLYVTVSLAMVLSVVFIGNICFADSTPVVTKKEETKAPENNKAVKQFNDWSFVVEEVSINVPNEKEKKADVKKVKIHYITNSVNSKEGYSIVRTDIIYSDVTKNQMVLGFTLPFGIDAQSAVTLNDGEKELLSSKVASCYQDGCRVGSELKIKLLEKILKAKDLKISFKAFGSEKAIELQIPTKGLKKAFDAMKKTAVATK
jgi:invasion protein IalB